MDSQVIHKRERSILHLNLSRAKERSLPATLTIDEWLITLHLFHGLCAYCQKEPYKVLDHVIPIVHKGGTTADNCVPACQRCNLWKRARLFPTTGNTLVERTSQIFQQLQQYRIPQHSYSPRKKKPVPSRIPLVMEQMLSPEQTAQKLNVSTAHVRYLIHSKKLRAKKVGRIYRIQEEWIRDYMNSEEEEPKS